ncbi:MAG: hypothetical protein ACRC4W_01750 [Treponemataceae bacterium]
MNVFKKLVDALSKSKPTDENSSSPQKQKKVPTMHIPVQDREWSDLLNDSLEQAAANNDESFKANSEYLTKIKNSSIEFKPLTLSPKLLATIDFSKSAAMQGFSGEAPQVQEPASEVGEQENFVEEENFSDMLKHSIESFEQEKQKKAEENPPPQEDNANTLISVKIIPEDEPQSTPSQDIAQSTASEPVIDIPVPTQTVPQPSPQQTMQAPSQSVQAPPQPAVQVQNVAAPTHDQNIVFSQPQTNPPQSMQTPPQPAVQAQSVATPTHDQNIVFSQPQANPPQSVQVPPQPAVQAQNTNPEIGQKNPAPQSTDIKITDIIQSYKEIETQDEPVAFDEAQKADDIRIPSQRVTLPNQTAPQVPETQAETPNILEKKANQEDEDITLANEDSDPFAFSTSTDSNLNETTEIEEPLFRETPKNATQAVYAPVNVIDDNKHHAKTAEMLIYIRSLAKELPEFERLNFFNNEKLLSLEYVIRALKDEEGFLSKARRLRRADAPTEEITLVLPKQAKALLAYLDKLANFLDDSDIITAIHKKIEKTMAII